jgi:hypothetical protein
LTDEVVTFVADRYAHASIETLRIRYGRIAELARRAAPSEQSAEDVLRHLRPESVNWPTDLSGAVRMADASGSSRSGGA